MKTISIADLKARLSEQLRMVQKGAQIVVTDRGRPVAMLVPIERDEEAELDELVALGLARRGRRKLDPSLLRPSPAKDPEGGVLAALLEERRTGW